MTTLPDLRDIISMALEFGPDELTSSDFTEVMPTYLGEDELLYLASKEDMLMFGLICLASEGIYYNGNQPESVMTTPLANSITNLRNALETRTVLVTDDFTCDTLAPNDLYCKYTVSTEFIYDMSDDDKVIFALLCLASEGIYY